jgi:serine/threonine protein kinase
MWSELHASLRYDDIKQVASPAQALDFPKPQVHRISCVSLPAMDHRNGCVYTVNNVLVRPSSDRAYLFKRKIAVSTYGSIRICLVLKRRGGDQSCLYQEKDGAQSYQVEWESTNEYVALKSSSWKRIPSKARDKHMEDPLKEAAALLHVGSYHRHILGCIEVLQDDEYLYTVMRYCAGGDLHSCIQGGPDNKNQKHKEPSENQARIWFRQLLEALFHLQKKGVCHRDISLENLLLDENNNLVLVDLGLALRVPYVDSSNYGGVCDVSEGYCRCLIRNQQGPRGNLSYLAPELVEPKDEFDGFAVDLWSAGIVLFLLLVGRAPFRWAHATDDLYCEINKGKLRDILRSMNPQINDDACDLLQNLLWRNPRKRMSLSQVMCHPWVVGSALPPPAPSEDRDYTPRGAFSPKKAVELSSPAVHWQLG